MAKTIKYKAIALDMDGTLLNSAKEISEANRETLIEYQKAGGRVIIATGRPEAGATRYCDQLEMEKYGGILLSYNSCRIVNLSNGDVIQNLTFSPEIVAKTEAVIREVDTEGKMSLATYQGRTLFTDGKENPYIKMEEVFSQMNAVPIESFKDTIDFPVNKCLVGADGDYLATKADLVSALLGNEVDAFRSDPWFLEIVPVGVDKLSGLKKIAEYLGITAEEMAACGDGFNDISMVKYAGFGVAMGNAQEVVKEVADFVSLTNDEDGVKYAIEKYIMI